MRNCARVSRTLVLCLSLLLLACGACMGGAVEETAAPSTPPAPRPAGPAQDAIYYIRTDGGSAEQCTGLVDAPYPGSGSGQPCAWDHPFRALPPDGTPLIQGGDTLIIGSGSYMMGYGADGDDNCYQDGAYDCHMPPLPAGPDPVHPTRLLGAGWDSGCPNPPELWGSERPWQIIDLSGSSNVEVACLEITDHSDCVEGHTGGLACRRDTPPFGPWAPIGIHAEDSSNAYLHDLNVHGLAWGGIHAGRLSDWTVEDVRIAGNGGVGWDGDLWEGGSSNSGTLVFRRWVVEWNGCGETYPGEEPTGCWGQTAGGYGDGVGTAATGGHWIIEDSSFLHNTSDGLDLLYHSEGGTIRLDRVHAEGNAGNQVKVTGQSVITNSLLVGNCAFFDGQPFTYDVDPCRALGNTLEVVYTGGEQVSIVHSTFYGQGDGLVSGGSREGYGCSGGETLAVRNSIFYGDKDYFDPGDITFLFYQENCADLEMDSDHNVIYQAKNVTCGVDGQFVNSGPQDICQDPLLEGPLSGSRYGMVPRPESPAVDSADAALCPALDILRHSRPTDGDGDGSAVCDRGAYELGGGTPPLTSTHLPLATKGLVEAAPPSLGEVNDFLYQLQNLDLAAIGATAYDLVVMDYSADGDEAGEFSAAEIAGLKDSPGGEKIVLAYMSIGEAEDYRFYWQDGWVPGNPAWLDVENPDWAGNYKVHYWDAGWQSILFSYTDRLLDAGFDGAYLDLIDAYEYYSATRPSAAQDMVDFVAAIGAYAHSRDPEFYLFPQNAAELGSEFPAYLGSIDGIGQEDIYYGYEEDDVATPPTVTLELEGYLDVFRDAGKLVLTVDYATTPAHVDAAYAQSLSQGYVPFVTVRDLDQLVIHPGHEPD